MQNVSASFIIHSTYFYYTFTTSFINRMNFVSTIFFHFLSLPAIINTLFFQANTKSTNLLHHPTVYTLCPRDTKSIRTHNRTANMYEYKYVRSLKCYHCLHVKISIFRKKQGIIQCCWIMTN